MVAEGVGRKLDPDSNIWTLAEPLIIDWVMENRGPEARLRGVVSEMTRRVERLPLYLSKLETLSDIVTAEGVHLHPDTVAAFYVQSKGGRYWRIATIVLALGLAALFLIELV